MRKPKQQPEPLNRHAVLQTLYRWVYQAGDYVRATQRFQEAVAIQTALATLSAADRERADGLPVPDRFRETTSELISTARAFGQDPTPLVRLPQTGLAGIDDAGVAVLLVAKHLFSPPSRRPTADGPTAADTRVPIIKLLGASEKEWPLVAGFLKGINPEWTDARIADEVGRNRSQLSRSRVFQRLKRSFADIRRSAGVARRVDSVSGNENGDEGDDG
jgi:hypothetical protein